MIRIHIIILCVGGITSSYDTFALKALYNCAVGGINHCKGFFETGFFSFCIVE